MYFTLWSSIYVFALIITARIPSLQEGNVLSHICLLRGCPKERFEQVRVVGGGGPHVVGYGM